jgi:hypothetical protein
VTYFCGKLEFGWPFQDFLKFRKLFNKFYRCLVKNGESEEKLLN